MKTSTANITILFTLLITALVACHPKSRSFDPTKDQVTVTSPEPQPEPEPEPLPQPEPEPQEPKPAKTFKVGDIIFHKSQSKQSKAIHEASESEWTHVGILVSKNGEWYVAEAVGPVVTTKLQDFIDRSKDKAYKIYRFKYFNPETMEEKLIDAIKKQNKKYDIYFELSDEKTYCSELVYKAMLEVTGHEIGVVQQFKDLKLDGPHMKDLIKRRLTDQGRELNPEEEIITPVSQMSDSNLILIKE